MKSFDSVPHVSLIFTNFAQADKVDDRDDTSSDTDSTAAATPETSPSLSFEEPEHHALRHQARPPVHSSRPARSDFGRVSDRASMRGARKCSICCETDITPDSAYAFPECNHTFCVGCWRRHILEDLKSGRFPPRSVKHMRLPVKKSPDVCSTADALRISVLISDLRKGLPYMP